MLSLETVLTVTVKSLTAPVPRPAAATVTESLAEYPVPPLTIVTPLTSPLASITTLSLSPLPVPPVGSTVCVPFCVPCPAYAPAVTVCATPSPGSSNLSPDDMIVDGSSKITASSLEAASQE